MTFWLNKSDQKQCWTDTLRNYILCFILSKININSNTLINKNISWDLVLLHFSFFFFFFSFLPFSLLNEAFPQHGGPLNSSYFDPQLRKKRGQSSRRQELSDTGRSRQGNSRIGLKWMKWFNVSESASPLGNGTIWAPNWHQVNCFPLSYTQPLTHCFCFSCLSLTHT